VRETLRVEREPRFRAFDITAHCGPHANEVRLETYENEHSYFLSPSEAIQLADALLEAAIKTQHAPQMEPAPWRRRRDE